MISTLYGGWSRRGVGEDGGWEAWQIDVVRTPFLLWLSPKQHPQANWPNVVLIKKRVGHDVLHSLRLFINLCWNVFWVSKPLLICLNVDGVSMKISGNVWLRLNITSDKLDSALDHVRVEFVIKTAIFSTIIQFRTSCFSSRKGIFLPDARRPDELFLFTWCPKKT